MTRFIRLAAVALGLAALCAPATPARSSSVHWSELNSAIGGTTSTTSSALYRYSTVIGGRPVRWNPCAAIHWRLRTNVLPAGVTPSAAYAMVASAVARVAAATGTVWHYDGGTTATPNSAWLPTSSAHINPVLIGWTDGNHSDLFHYQPYTVLGMTRTAYFGIINGTTEIAATKSAVIGLNIVDHLPLSGTALSWRTVLLHELGHAMGLAHVPNPSELMNPVLSTSLRDLQSGDLQGLSHLGRAAGCVNLGF